MAQPRPLVDMLILLGIDHPVMIVNDLPGNTMVVGTEIIANMIVQETLKTIHFTPLKIVKIIFVTLILVMKNGNDIGEQAI